jgi:lantibiotic modifying enzyme
MSRLLSRRAAFLSKAPSQDSIFAPADYLEAAKQAARWINASATKTPDGIGWLPEPDDSAKTATVSSPLTIYSGNAGIVLFLLQLSHVTLQGEYLQKAKRGADLLAKQWPSVASFKGDLLSSPYSFYNGLSGVAFTLLETWKATGEQRYRDAALAITTEIVQAAKPADRGITWTNSPALGFGDSGIALYLLYAADLLADESYLQLAAEAGEHLLSAAQEDPRGGLRWFGFTNPEQFKLPKDTYFPNFEIGTAGTAYTLARLYQVTKNQRFLEAAEAGALHLRSIATVKGDSALVHYREPDLTDLYYLGYGHGPTGTARLFYQLHKATGHTEHLAWTEKLARGIVASGAPDKQTSGLWYVVCQRCGSAGVSDFFLGLWAGTGKNEYLAATRRFSDQLLSRGTNFDGNGYRWYQAWTRVKPAEVSADTGYMIGAAGEAAALLHLYLVSQNRYAAIVFPDNPFPVTAPA